MYLDTFTANYSRLEQTVFAYQRVRALKCLIAGAGALGNEVARVLGLLGIGSITIIDPDYVEVSNLSRSIFFNDRNRIGENKAVALTTSAAKMFPMTNWAAIPTEIADVGFQSLAQSDLLFSCVDSDLARLEIAYIGKAVHIPVADGGLGRQNYSHGRVTYFSGSIHQACYACMLSAQKRAELLQNWRAIVHPCSDNHDAGENVIASTPMMAGIMAGVQAELGLRAILESGRDEARSVEVRIHPSPHMEEVQLKVSATCPFHEVQEFRMAIPSTDVTFEHAMDLAESDLLLLDWPVCVSARCLNCESEWSPRIRVAALRRNGRCPTCGASKILELEVIRAIDRESRWIRNTPAELQLPANHIYRLRPRCGAQ